MPTLFIATHNSHKVAEIRAILGEAFEYRTLREFPNAPRVVEDAPSFAGNATKKAVELANWLAARRSLDCPMPAFVLADDSGLEVDVLQGAPGVLSARFAAEQGSAGNSTDADNSAKLLRLLASVPRERRTARFRCVLALTPLLESVTQNASPGCEADPMRIQTQLFEGHCEGHIGFAAQGQGGFGYDPLFIPLGFEQTFAQLGDAVKNGISHRAKALEALKADFHKLGPVVL
jgi:XTP/dITP diphosphohydrolase